MNPYDHIEDYLFNRLSESQIKEFEAALLVDNHLKKELEDLKIAQQITARLIEIETRQQIKNLQQNTSSKSRSFQFILKIVASILIIVGLIWIIYKPTQVSIDKDTLVAELYEKPNEAERGGSANLTTLDSAVLFFEKGDLAISQAFFNKVSPTDSIQQYTIDFYKAHLLFLYQNYTEAAKAFTIIANHNSRYTLEARFNLMLCYIKLDKTSQAKIIYTDLKDQCGRKQNDLLSHCFSKR